MPFLKNTTTTTNANRFYRLRILKGQLRRDCTVCDSHQSLPFKDNIKPELNDTQVSTDVTKKKHQHFFSRILTNNFLSLHFQPPKSLWKKPCQVGLCFNHCFRLIPLLTQHSFNWKSAVVQSVAPSFVNKFKFVIFIYLLNKKKCENHQHNHHHSR